MPTHKPPVPGILFVNSDILPTQSQLSKQTFNTWYCNEHIPDVVAKSGISYAYWYEHVIDRLSAARRLNFLTIYGMDDINFAESEEFRSLKGQKPGPNKEGILKRPSLILGRPARFLLYAAMSHSSNAELDEWYRGEHVETISKCPRYRRTSRYKIATRSLLSGFERSFPPAMTWLALHEFEGPEVPWKELAATDETEWAKKVLPGITEIDFGLFELKRVFGEGEKARL
ncbi:hypothetical protein G7Y89_g6837 [Cudoniella acicularis]|uniref:Uncharacterized protein n=1 Tax=Cudoniella acicularis TaxID=354080 RepID=A0A8H4RLI5_9HELO|nr:hypothetical protein G7Y89_g6837 [Cudoniella acicularis]